MPLGAYDLLPTLKGVASQKPTTVYRALEWLEALGLIRRIGSISKYVALPAGPTNGLIAFSICRECGLTVEIPCHGEVDALVSLMRDQGYLETGGVLEMVGLCRAHSGRTEAADKRIRI